MIAYAAVDDLTAMGQQAWPELLNSLHDQRQPIALRRVLPSTVGDACYCIVMFQIYDLPKGYRGSYFRKGADGELHERPFYSKHLFDSDTIQQWLDERKGKSPNAIQLEAVSRVLSEEEKIGVKDAVDEVKFLVLLREKLAELKMIETLPSQGR